MPDEILEQEFRRAKAEWQDAFYALHRAKADYDYAETRLTLARDQLILHAVRAEPSRPWDVDLAAELMGVEYLGKTITQAVQAALQRLEQATADQLAEAIRQRGYQFVGDAAPARMIHGALIQQPWARRNKRTGEWEYVEL
ncbi:MAG TPA: hypothetical protein VLS25_02760 [Dehalococcoidia bacterium]|nr:hypothetical protein [Dehalococcoidia bacterium]